jgi:hypothetical protein
MCTKTQINNQKAARSSLADAQIEVNPKASRVCVNVLKPAVQELVKAAERN